MMPNPTTSPDVVENNDQPSENDRLLGDESEEGVPEQPKGHRFTVIKLYAAVFFVMLAVQILGPAQTRIFESMFCSAWYNEHPSPEVPSHGEIPETYCKIASVQTELSTFLAWLNLVNAAPGLLLTVPVGMLSDVIGRRFLLFSNFTVFFLIECWVTLIMWFGGQISLHYIYFGALLNLLGGGATVLEMLITCALTDIVPGGKLTNALLRMTAFGMCSKIVGPTLAAFLMHHNPWLAIYCGLGAQVLSVIIIATMPETHHRTKAVEASIESTGLSVRQKLEAVFRSTHTSLQDLRRVWSDWRLVFISLTFPMRVLSYALSVFVQLYVSNRYGWSLADATLVYSVQGVGSATMLLLILPFVSDQIEHRLSFSIIQKNVVLSRFSLAALAVSYTIIGTAPVAPLLIVGLLIETLSTGLPSTMNALAAALVGTGDTGTVYSVLALVETCSTMVAYPLSASLFNIGIEKGGGMWLGLPYDTIALAAAVAFVTMCLIRFDRRGST